MIQEEKQTQVSPPSNSGARSLKPKTHAQSQPSIASGAAEIAEKVSRFRKSASGWYQRNRDIIDPLLGFLAEETVRAGLKKARSKFTGNERRTSGHKAVVTEGKKTSVPKEREHTQK